ncbi:ribosome-recycling factor, mitochondrial isoform X5 [Periplaneta americana]|uniref:ribosome-recycling factor, mitochondrial isoform X5 n=1 Tax=Periplaneta americana TaxID=6978 RepID=UPI0037E70AC5
MLLLCEMNIEGLFVRWSRHVLPLISRSRMLVSTHNRSLSRLIRGYAKGKDRGREKKKTDKGSIETLSVNFEGKEYELQELAQIVRKNPKTIIVNMTAFPQTIPATLEAIAKSGMNLNPQQDGTTLFIPVPKVTKEHRENLAKSAKALFVKCKDSIREVQNKFVRNVKNNTNISQDLAYNVQEQIIALGDQYVSEGEKIYEAKHTELIGKE